MEREKIGGNIFIINKYFRVFLKDSLKIHNLNIAECMVLLSLYSVNKKSDENDCQLNSGCEYHTERTQKQLVDDLCYDKSVMTRTMHALEEKGYIIKRCNVSDSRSFLLQLTEKAWDFQPVLFDIVDRWNAQIVKDLDETSLGKVEEITSKMSDNARNIMYNPKNRIKKQKDN